MSVALPDWMSHEASVFAVWGAREESPRMVAERVVAFAERTRGSVPSWRFIDERGQEPVTADPGAVEKIVAASAYRDDEGELSGGMGFTFSLSGEFDGGHVAVRHTVGRAIAGRRLPANHVQVLFPKTSADVDAVHRAVIETWEPESACAVDSETLRVMSETRGRWTPRVGRRTFLSAELGSVARPPEGITVEQMSGGVLLTADDGWEAQRVVDELMRVISDNGIRDISH